MSIIPEYDNTNFLKALLLHKMFTPEHRGKTIEFISGGYLLFRKSDDRVWGTADINAFYLYQDKEIAEGTLRMLGDDWEMKEVVCADAENLKDKRD